MPGHPAVGDQRPILYHETTGERGDRVRRDAEWRGWFGSCDIGRLRACFQRASVADIECHWPRLDRETTADRSNAGFRLPTSAAQLIRPQILTPLW